MEKKNLGIWENEECVQCGACCEEYINWLYKIEARKTERCEFFDIKNQKAYCTIYDGKRKKICETYFCGDIDPHFRENQKLRKIAFELGTTPKNWEENTNL